MKLFYLLTFFLLITNTRLIAQPAYVFYEKAEENYGSKAYGEALKNIGEALKKDAKMDKAYLLRAQILIAQGKKTEALADLNKTIELNNKNEKAFEERVALNRELGDKKKVDEDLNKILAINPNNGTVYFLRGVSKYGEGNYKDAIADFDKASQNKYNKGDNFYYWASGLFNLPNRKPSDLNTALEKVNKAIQLDNNNGTFHLLKGKIYLALSDKEKALNAFSDADKRGIKTEELCLLRYPLALELNADELALMDLNRLIIEFKTKSGKIYLDRANLFIKKNDLINASKDINKAIPLEKENPEVYLMKAKLSIAQKKMSTVQFDLTKAIDLGTKNPEAYLLRGDLFFKLKKYQQALDDYTQCIKAKPDKDLYYQRSKCYNELKNAEAACTDVKKAAEMGHKQAAKDIIYICK